MRTIVHLSDLHFGRLDKSRIGPLLEEIRRINPNVVVISGDFTQRARTSEYRDARDFVQSISQPIISIPGNHDVRYLNSPLARFLEPFGRYKRYINPTLEPVYLDNEIAIAGLNTSRASKIVDGKVSKSQIDKLKNWFKELPKNVIKIVVTHHPLDLPPHWPDRKLAIRAEKAIAGLGEAGVDLYMSGHYHLSFVSRTADRYKIDGYSAITVQAGTLSERRRKDEFKPAEEQDQQLQSFNIIEVDHHHIKIKTYLWNITRGGFEQVDEHTFKYSKGQWHPVENDPKE